MEDVDVSERVPNRESRSIARRRAFALAVAAALCWASIMTLLPGGGDTDNGEPIPATIAYLPHDPITIEGDEEFTAENGVVSGSGTDDDPYVISEWNIDMSEEAWPESAVLIANTTAAFVLSGLWVHGEGTYAIGLSLLNVSAATVDGCRAGDLNGGVMVQSSSGVRITGNEFIRCDCLVLGSADVEVDGNEGTGATVRVVSSSNVTVTHNEVNYSLAGGEPRGFRVAIDESDRCQISENSLWTALETSPREASIVLSRSTNCSVHGNAMNRFGLGFDATTLSQIATHDIGDDNTVGSLPLLFIGNAAGVVIDQAGFGQLVVANCSDVRIRDLAISGLGSEVGVWFCSDTEVSDCTFSNMQSRSGGAMSISDSSEVRVRHNEFINGSEVWFEGCSGLNFSDNGFVSETYGSLHVSELRDSVLENNEFHVMWGVMYLHGSSNLTVRNNVLPDGGIVLSGYDPGELDSHTIDGTNMIGMKPVRYLAGMEGGDVDLSNNSQVILASCSGLDLHGMSTGASNAIQMGFSEDITLHDCGIYGSGSIDLRYADNVTFYENDFVDPLCLMHLTMTNNVTMYHCNIMGEYGLWGASGFDGYVPANIRWDNGYPDGGNYWEGSCRDDNFSGPDQDISGPDGICDMARNVPWGSDRYPLVSPYVHNQWTEPEEVWEDPVLWLSAIAFIVLASAGISYLLFVREPPARRPPEAGGGGEP